MSSIKDLPFNVKLMNADQRRLMLTRPTTSTDIYDPSTGGFDENGLYSTLTFGEINSPERNTLFSYIDLKTTLIHPFIFRELMKLNGKYLDLISKKKNFEWDYKNNDFILSESEKSNNGFGFFMTHYSDIIFKPTSSDRRQLRIDLLDKYRKDSLLQNHLIIPAGLRDLEINDDGRETEDEVNPLYRKLIAISRSIGKGDLDQNNPVYDNSRWKMQQTLEEIFTVFFRLVTGKKGFIQRKFARRRVFDGTRNVITSMDTSSSIMNAPKQIKSMDTQFGLFQTLRGTLPLSINLIKNDWLGNVLSEGSEYITLVDRDKLTSIDVKLSSKAIDTWASDEGLEKSIVSFKYPSKRHKPVYIDGHYIGLIYQDNKCFKFFNNISDLPESLNQNHVRPITWGELFYHALYKKIDDIFAIVTRYPVTGEGSTYPSHAYVKTTTESLTMTELNDNWEIDDSSLIYYEWPSVLNDSSWIDSMSPSSIRLARLGADFDGDTMSATFVFSDESVEECRKYIDSKKSLLDANGSFFHGIITDLCEWVLLNLTR